MTPVQVIDSQIHIWEPTAAEGQPESAREPMTIERLIHTMDAAGIDAALVVTNGRLYGPDNSYSLKAAALHPDRLAVVGTVDLTHPEPERLLATWLDQPGMVAWRLAVTKDGMLESLESGPGSRFLAAAERHRVPVCIYAPGRLPQLGSLPRLFPDLQFVLCHLGIGAGVGVGSSRGGHEAVGDPFASIPDLVALARYPNVAVKASGVPAWSREGYPYQDVWPALHAVIGAYGADRVMWGTDLTNIGKRIPPNEAVRYVLDSAELSEGDKDKVMGKSLARVFRWTPKGYAPPR